MKISFIFLPVMKMSFIFLPVMKMSFIFLPVMKMSFIFSEKTKGWKSENLNNKNKNKNNNKNNNNNNNNKAIPRTALLAVKNMYHIHQVHLKVNLGLQLTVCYIG